MSHKKHRVPQIVLRASDQYRHYIKCLAADQGMTVTEFFDEIIKEHAKSNNKPLPPRRWPPETS